jgi:hypothetical protein
MNYRDLTIGSIAQLITNDFKGMGIVKHVDKEFIVLEPHSNKQILDKYGDSVSHLVIVPTTEIKLTIVLEEAMIAVTKEGK